uniref:Uncharacterized protein n=1 Tax=Romanomermis culicivorax TaxID=13658 RepID=A0A915L6I1_ROMCU
MDRISNKAKEKYKRMLKIIVFGSIFSLFSSESTTANECCFFDARLEQSIFTRSRSGNSFNGVMTLRFSTIQFWDFPTFRLSRDFIEQRKAEKTGLRHLDKSSTQTEYLAVSCTFSTCESQVNVVTFNKIPEHSDMVIQLKKKSKLRIMLQKHNVNQHLQLRFPRYHLSIQYFSMTIVSPHTKRDPTKANFNIDRIAIPFMRNVQPIRRTKNGLSLKKLWIELMPDGRKMIKYLHHDISGEIWYDNRCIQQSKVLNPHLILPPSENGLRNGLSRYFEDTVSVSSSTTSPGATSCGKSAVKYDLGSSTGKITEKIHSHHAVEFDSPSRSNPSLINRHNFQELLCFENKANT